MVLSPPVDHLWSTSEVSTRTSLLAVSRLTFRFPYSSEQVSQAWKLAAFRLMRVGDPQRHSSQQNELVTTGLKPYMCPEPALTDPLCAFSDPKADFGLTAHLYFYETWLLAYGLSQYPLPQSAYTFFPLGLF